MGRPHMEDAIGVVDGVNTLFNTQFAYRAGSLSVFINGQLKRQQDDDGWYELGGTSFQLKEAPLSDVPVGGPEKVRVFYTDTTLEESVLIEDLVVTLDALDEFTGTLQEVETVNGILQEIEELSGTLDDIEELAGVLEEIDVITATLGECA